MSRDKGGNGASPESVISIIGPGMKIVGDCETDGTIRVEGSVEGSVRAGKAVVVGKDGQVSGSVVTQDAVVAGRVIGSVIAESRLELQATSRIEGEVYARRLQLEEGAILNGTVDMGDRPKPKPKSQAEGQEAAGNGRAAAHQGGAPLARPQPGQPGRGQPPQGAPAQRGQPERGQAAVGEPGPDQSPAPPPQPSPQAR